MNVHHSAPIKKFESKTETQIVKREREKERNKQNNPIQSQIKQSNKFSFSFRYPFVLIAHKIYIYIRKYVRLLKKALSIAFVS
ncbi:hypothetical protein BKA81DRAFT_356992 [Phyllosticta paracitricarpa]